MTQFLAGLAREDLSPATLRGYRYDLRYFLRWHRGVTDAPFAPDRLAEYDLITYRQQMIVGGRRPATINRRLEALRRLGRWAHSTGVLAANVVRDIRPVRTVRNRQPAGLTDREIHALLRAAGASRHGLAPRNYALVQLCMIRAHGRFLDDYRQAPLRIVNHLSRRHRQVVGCWIVKGAMDCSTIVGRRDHAAMATPVTSAQVANAWRRAE